MNKLQKSVFEALKLLIKNDIEIIKNKTKEECINHKLAQYLENILLNEKILTVHNVDIEYNKYKKGEKKSADGRNIRPDIIVHERKSGNRNNLIVIEAKKDYESEKDRGKIRNLVQNKETYSYSLGVAISYLPNKDYIKIKFLTPDNCWRFYWLYKKDFKIKETTR